MYLMSLKGESEVDEGDREKRRGIKFRSFCSKTYERMKGFGVGGQRGWRGEGGRGGGVRVFVEDRRDKKKNDILAQQYIKVKV